MQQPCTVQGLVSVPLRGCLFEIRSLKKFSRTGLLTFPSPYGDVCLKKHATKAYMILSGAVSVPLRGCLFEIERYSHLYREASKAVSVPLRGCLFEMHGAGIDC